MSDAHRIQHIDAWRFIAVSLVIQGHLFVHSLSLANQFPFLRRLGRFGTFGVLIFFVISGFVICRGLMEERAGTTVVSLKAFYVRRAFRILPPLYLYLAALTLLGFIGWIGISPPQISNSALFLCNLDVDCSWFAGHTWSLAYEEQFYLLFPALFVVLGLGPRPRVLLLILGVMVLLSLGCRGLGMDWLAGYLRHMAFVLTGCGAALYWDRLAPLCRSLSFSRWIAALAVLVACVGLLPYPLEAYVQTMLYPPLIGLLVLGTPLAQPRVRAFFQNPWVSYLGKISYTVYLWQQLAMSNFSELSPWWTVLFLVGVWLFAHGSYRYFERPLIGVAAKWSDSIKRRAAALRVVGGHP